jgi:hypothetical protein
MSDNSENIPSNPIQPSLDAEPSSQESPLQKQLREKAEKLNHAEASTPKPKSILEDIRGKPNLRHVDTTPKNEVKHDELKESGDISATVNKALDRKQTRIEEINKEIEAQVEAKKKKDAERGDVVTDEEWIDDDLDNQPSKPVETISLGNTPSAIPVEVPAQPVADEKREPKETVKEASTPSPKPAEMPTPAADTTEKHKEEPKKATTSTSPPQKDLNALLRNAMGARRMVIKDEDEEKEDIDKSQPSINIPDTHTITGPSLEAQQPLSNSEQMAEGISNPTTPEVAAEATNALQAAEMPSPPPVEGTSLPNINDLPPPPPPLPEAGGKEAHATEATTQTAPTPEITPTSQAQSAEGIPTPPPPVEGQAADVPLPPPPVEAPAVAAEVTNVQEATQTAKTGPDLPPPPQPLSQADIDASNKLEGVPPPPPLEVSGQANDVGGVDLPPPPPTPSKEEIESLEQPKSILPDGVSAPSTAAKTEPDLPPPPQPLSQADLAASAQLEGLAPPPPPVEASVQLTQATEPTQSNPELPTPAPLPDNLPNINPNDLPPPPQMEVSGQEKQAQASPTTSEGIERPVESKKDELDKYRELQNQAKPLRSDQWYYNRRKESAESTLSELDKKEKEKGSLSKDELQEREDAQKQLGASKELIDKSNEYLSTHPDQRKTDQSVEQNTQDLSSLQISKKDASQMLSKLDELEKGPKEASADKQTNVGKDTPVKQAEKSTAPTASKQTEQTKPQPTQATPKPELKRQDAQQFGQANSTIKKDLKEYKKHEKALIEERDNPKGKINLKKLDESTKAIIQCTEKLIEGCNTLIKENGSMPQLENALKKLQQNLKKLNEFSEKLDKAAKNQASSKSEHKPSKETSNPTKDAAAELQKEMAKDNPNLWEANKLINKIADDSPDPAVRDTARKANVELAMHTITDGTGGRENGPNTIEAYKQKAAKIVDAVKNSPVKEQAAAPKHGVWDVVNVETKDGNTIRTLSHNGGKNQLQETRDKEGKVVEVKVIEGSAKITLDRKDEQGNVVGKKEVLVIDKKIEAKNHFKVDESGKAEPISKDDAKKLGNVGVKVKEVDTQSPSNNNPAKDIRNKLEASSRSSTSAQAVPISQDKLNQQQKSSSRGGI